MTGRIVFLVLQFLSMKICQRTTHFLKCGCKGMPFFPTHQIFHQVFSKKSVKDPKKMYLCHHERTICTLSDRNHAFGQRDVRAAFLALRQEQRRHLGAAHRGPGSRPLTPPVCRPSDARPRMAGAHVGRGPLLPERAPRALRRRSGAPLQDGSRLSLLLHARRHHGHTGTSRKRRPHRLCRHLPPKEAF